MNIGLFYDEGIYVARNTNQAISWYKKAYKQGSGGAANNIAIHFKDIKEYRKALWWFHRATKLLDHDAYFDIGYFYEKGFGVRKNVKKALSFYKKAIEAEYITEHTVEKAKERIEKLKT